MTLHRIRSEVLDESSTFYLKRMGAKVLPYRVYQLELSEDAEDVWNHTFNGKVRNLVRKAEKKGLTLENGNLMQRFDGDYEAIFHSAPIRQGRRMRRSDGTPRLALPSLHEPTHGLETGAIINRIMVGYGKLIDYGGLANICTFLTHKSYWPYGVSELLMWGIVQTACENGIDIIEYGIPAGEGIDHFREQFGFRLHDCHLVYIPTTLKDRIKALALSEIQTASQTLEGNEVKRILRPIFNRYVSNALYKVGL